MICRWRLRVLPKISLFLPKSQALAAAYHLASPIECSTNSKPQKSFPFRTFSNQEHLNQPPKTTFLNPQIVLHTVQNCPSDLIALSFFLWCARQPHYFHDKLAFRHMVSVVSNLTHTYGTVKGIIQELESVGCVTRAQTLLLLMRIYWCGAMYDMVLEAYEDMINYGYIPNTYARNIVMDVLFKIKHVDVALKVLRETHTPNFLSFSIAICNLCRLNDVNNVKGVLRCMLMKGYYMNPETYTFVLNCFCRFARLEEALQLLGMMIVLGAPVSVNFWSILIDGFCKSGHIEVAAYLLEKMIKIGCSPNIVTCTSLVKGFLESWMPQKAFEILRTLESKGCFPDLVLCNVLIDCLAKMGWYEDAFEVFCSLQELKLMPDVYTFSSLVSTICLSRQYVLLPLLTSGLAVQPDLVVCNCLLSYFCKAGYPEGAIEFYDDMIDRGFLPDKYSFAGALSALCRLGRIREAVNVYHGIIRCYPDVDAHIHTIMINGLIKSGNLQKAMRLFSKAATEKLTLDVVSYNVAIDGLIRGGLTKEAYDMFSLMKEKDVAPNKCSYNLILSGFCRDRDVYMVKHLVQEMIDRHIEIEHHTYKLMQNLLCNSSNSRLAFDLFLELGNMGLLPKVEQVMFVNSLSDSQYVLDSSTSSSDDVSDAVVSVR